MKNFSSKAFYKKVIANIKNVIFIDNNKRYKFEYYLYNHGVYNLIFEGLDDKRGKGIQLYWQHLDDFKNTLELINKCFDAREDLQC